MNFIEAIKSAVDGSKIRRSTWEHHKWIKISERKKEMGGIRFYRFPFVGETGLVEGNFVIQEMLAEDWEIYKEQPQRHTFEEAITAFKQGSTIKRLETMMEYNMGDILSGIKLFTIRDVCAYDWIIKQGAKE